MTNDTNCQNKSVVVWNVSEDESWVRASQEQASNNTDLRLEKDRLSFRSPFIWKLQTFAERALWDLALKSEIDPTSQLECYVVQSTRCPDSPPWVFLSKDERCRCKERLKELNQCVHKILLRGGFDQSYFLERHFSWDCVKGSLSGWSESSEDYLRRHVEMWWWGDWLWWANWGIACDEQTNLNVQTSHDHQIAMNSSVGVKPLLKKQVSNILTAVCGAYFAFSQEQQFEISKWKLRNDSWSSKSTRTIDSVQETNSTNAQNPGKHCIKENSEELAKHWTIVRCVSRILLHSSKW